MARMDVPAEYVSRVTAFFDEALADRAEEPARRLS
jgi:hypothetical protein